jgi:hypothetical protein
MAFLLHPDTDSTALQGLILSPDEAARQRAERLWRTVTPVRRPWRETRR